MKSLIAILLLFTLSAHADNYSQLKSKFESNKYLKNLKFPTRAQFEGRHNKNLMGQDYDEAPRPIRTAKVTLKVYKSLLDEENGEFKIKEEEVCAKIVYFNVYEDGNQLISEGDLERAKCYDAFYDSKSNSFTATDISIGGLVVESDVKYPDSVISGPVKLYGSLLFVTPSTLNLGEGALQDTIITTVATKELKNKSIAQSLSPSYFIECSNSGGSVGVGDEVKDFRINSNEITSGQKIKSVDCSMSFPVIYRTELHIEDDQV